MGRSGIDATRAMRSERTPAGGPAVRALALLLAVCASSPAPAREREMVGWRDAARCVGRVCGVRGTVQEVADEGPALRLFFDPQDHRTSVLLIRGLLVSWPDYAGRTIVATGPVRRFRDQIEIVVRAPKAVEVLPPAGSTAPAATAAPESPAPTPSFAPSPATSAAPAASPTPNQSEVERLRQRVRDLEKRLRELESGP
jgi:hypothetical protein